MTLIARSPIMIVLYAVNFLSLVGGISMSESSLKLSIGSLRDLRQAPIANTKNSDVNRTIVVAIPGESAKLACPIPSELLGTKVSWIRRRDFQLLSVGEAMYANDNRIFVSHSRHSHYQGSRHSQVWFLHLLNVTNHDEGEYECQTSNHPHISTVTFLKVQSASSVILGASERVVAAGSQLRLVCSIKNSSKELSYLFWYQDSKMINYDETQGVQVFTGKDFSTLTIASIKPSQAGNYTCEPSNTTPSAVIVHVVEENSNVGAFLPGTDREYTSQETGSSSGSRSDSSSANTNVNDSHNNNNDNNINSDNNINNTPSDKTSVRQLGVKSASSVGLTAYPQNVLAFGFALAVCIDFAIEKIL